MKRAFLIALVLLASACASQPLRPGMSEAEVVQAMGRPAIELRDQDGSRHLAYPTGPFGLHTYMARIAADGRLRVLEQVLDDGRFDAIRPGMTRDELLRHIGPPGERMRFDNLRQTAWDYRFRDTWGYIAILSVMVDDSGRVASRITRRLEREHRLF